MEIALTAIYGIARPRALKVLAHDMIPELRALKAGASGGTGPIEGPARDILGWFKEDPERKVFLQQSNAVQRIVGKILEGGKLGDKDAAVYEKFILDPNSMDDEEFTRMIDSVESFLASDLAAFDNEQKTAGRRVGPTTNKPAGAEKDPADMTDEEIAAELGEAP